MAFKDSAGAVTLHGLIFSAAAAASVYSAQPEGPSNGSAIPSLATVLQIRVSSVSGLGADVGIEVARDAAFTDVVYGTTMVNWGPGLHGANVTGLVDTTTYYWRVRAAETGTTGWTAWSATWTFTANLNAGRAYGYVEVNGGIELTPDPDAAWPVEANVGVVLYPDQEWAWSSDFNVGVEITLSSVFAHHAHEGDVSTNTPTPHLWWLSPPAGRPGDGMRIFCFGVGDLASTYGAVVEVDYGGARGWQPVQSVSWQTHGADPNAYTEARMIDKTLEYIDMQHQVVEITVPEDALPPGYPIRIRTEGP